MKYQIIDKNWKGCPLEVMGTYPTKEKAEEARHLLISERLYGHWGEQWLEDQLREQFTIREVNE